MTKKKKRERYLWTVAEKKKILKEYDKAPKGEKWAVLNGWGIHASHIFAWRQQLEA